MARDTAWSIVGSVDMYGGHGTNESGTYAGYNSCVNFFTCHDGFSLYDLYSYNEKHNESNGWNNTDGSDNNRSWNCGAEGETEDPEILKLRFRMIRNACAVLMCSRGTPMFLAGDEFGNENKALLLFEKTGEALTTICVLIFDDFNLHSWSNWSWWLVAAFVLMAMYELWWIRYFLSERKLSDFYSSFLGVPLAGATLPVFAFLLLGIYGKVIWLSAAAVILGIGHIGIHMQHSRELKKSALQ